MEGSAQSEPVQRAPDDSSQSSAPAPVAAPESASESAPESVPESVPTASGGAPPTAASHKSHHGSSSKHNKWKHSSSPPPTNCVVLKNLDYNINQATLEEVVRRVTGGRKEFVNISLIDDKATGTFRGMAFVNFHTTADASAALAELSKMVINKRKVIAEFRRLRPGEKERKEAQEKRAKKFDHFHKSNRQTFERDVQDTDASGHKVDKRTAFFARRDTVRKTDDQKRFEERAERDKEREEEFRNRLLEYRNTEVPEGGAVEDVVFESSLTSYERRMVHTLCAGLELGHISRVDDDGNRVLHVTKDPERKAEWDKETAKIQASIKKEETQKRKNKENQDARHAPEWKKVDTISAGPLTKEELQGVKFFKPRSVRAAAAAADPDAAADSGEGIRAPSYKLYVPPRQPCGPDGSIGFKSRGGGEEVTEEEEAGENGNATGHEASNEEAGESGDAIEEGANDLQNAQAEKDVAVDVEKGSAHKVLNPSLPAFAPSFTQSY